MKTQDAGPKIKQILRSYNKGRADWAEIPPEPFPRLDGTIPDRTDFADL